MKENNSDYQMHKIRFYAPVDVMEKLVAYDGTLIESSVKRVLTGSETQTNCLCQFTTLNCGKVTAQQRLINYLIQALK